MSRLVFVDAQRAVAVGVERLELLFHIRRVGKADLVLVQRQSAIVVRIQLAETRAGSGQRGDPAAAFARRDLVLITIVLPAFLADADRVGVAGQGLERDGGGRRLCGGGKGFAAVLSVVGLNVAGLGGGCLRFLDLGVELLFQLGQLLRGRVEFALQPQCLFLLGGELLDLSNEVGLCLVQLLLEIGVFLLACFKLLSGVYLRLVRPALGLGQAGFCPGLLGGFRGDIDRADEDSRRHRQENDQSAHCRIGGSKGHDEILEIPAGKGYLLFSARRTALSNSPLTSAWKVHPQAGTSAAMFRQQILPQRRKLALAWVCDMISFRGGIAKARRPIVHCRSMEYPGREGPVESARVMMSPGESFVYFGCPRCTAPLKAPAAKAGQCRRCPVCQYAVNVPHASPDSNREEYAFDDNLSAAVDAEPEIAFTCPICHTRMTAPQEQLGQQIACPDCRTPVTVPEKSVVHRRKELLPLEDYALCRTSIRPRRPVSSRSTFPFSADDVARSCKCRRTVWAAKSPARIAVSPRSPKRRGCAASGKRPPRARPTRCTRKPGHRRPTRFPIRSTSASSAAAALRLHALRAEMGQEIVCPECGRSVTVPWRERKQKQPMPALPAQSKDPYKIQPAVAAQQQPEEDPDRPPAWFGERYKRMLAKDSDFLTERPPPRWPLVSGVFTFPWQAGSLKKWVMLSVGVMPIAMLALSGFLVFQCLAIGFGLYWAAVLFANLLTILTDTAAGADDVACWPGALEFTEWAGGAMLLFTSLWLTMTIGGGLNWLLWRAGLPGGYVLVGVVGLLFPIVLLSMLEGNSPLVPLSKVIYRGLLDHRRAWIAFYLETILLGGATAGLAIADMLTGNFLWAIPLLALTIVASSMIYFRLLGRLAWCCSQ